MKILRIIPSIDPRGGGPCEAARRIDAQLVRLGHTVEVVCLDSRDESYVSDYPTVVHALGPARRGYRYSGQLVPWLKRNRNRFDAAIVNGVWQYHSFAAWRALAGTDTPYFVFTHGMLDPWFKRTYPLKHIKKWMYWPWADYRVLRDARAVLFTSEEERRLARESFWLYSCREVVSAYGTSNAPEDSDGALAGRFRSKYPELQGKRILLFLSRIHEKKGCDLLLKAFARVARSTRDLHLVMAGPDQTGWKGALQELAVGLDIAERVTWPGMLQGDEKWGAYHAAEAFCLPSHQENFGVVVAEALSCGTPVLISNKVNIWREVESDGAGIVGEDNLEGTCQAISSWLMLDEVARNEMSLRAKSAFSRRFHIDKVVDSFLSVIS